MIIGTQINRMRFLNCDCVQYMKTLGDGAFDLAIVDPPYGIGADVENAVTGYSDGRFRPRDRMQFAGKEFAGKKARRWDDFVPGPDYFKELLRVSKQQIIFGGNYFDLPPSPVVFVWDKEQPWANFNELEMAWTSFRSPVKSKIFHFKSSGPLIKNRWHPTQKPIDLYSFLLKTFAEKGMKILDTHLGSGSSAIAAHFFGCEFTGCELDEVYFSAAMKHIREEIGNPLFDYAKLEGGSLF